MKKAFFAAVLCFSLAFLGQPVFASSPVVDPFQVCDESSVDDTSICKAQESGGGLFGPNSVWNNILNVLTFVIGAISVLMIIVGAMRYALSQGDQSAIASAKNTILYAIIALVIAVMANAIVNFVLTNI